MKYIVGILTVLFGALLIGSLLAASQERYDPAAYARAEAELNAIERRQQIDETLLPLDVLVAAGWRVLPLVVFAGLAGVLAAPIIQVNPLMGSNLIIVVFAVVVIGGMGSILGSVVTGLGLGVIEGFTRVLYPEASSVVVFVIMAIVLVLRPAGLFGKEA